MRNFTTICALILVLILTGCSKYDEGGFSLRSKKARLVNKWKLEQIFMDGKEIQVQGMPVSEADIWVEYKKDESYEEYDGFTGKWEFDDSKEYIRMYSDNSQLIYEWRIIKLKNNELIYEYGTDELIEHHYKTY